MHASGDSCATPVSFNRRPLDPAAFGTEPSPNAAVTQEARTEATIAAVREAAAKGNGSTSAAHKIKPSHEVPVVSTIDVCPLLRAHHFLFIGAEMAEAVPLWEARSRHRYHHVPLLVPLIHIAVRIHDPFQLVLPIDH